MGGFMGFLLLIQVTHQVQEKWVKKQGRGRILLLPETEPPDCTELIAQRFLS